MDNKIRFGIIGCGDVTEVKSGPAFQKARHSELVAVIRRSGKLAEDYARRHGVPRWYTHARKLIEALAAAKAGKPVYVGKPMALNPAECGRMTAACREAWVRL